MATSPLPSWGSPTLSAGREWLPDSCSLEGPITGQSGYITPTVWGLQRSTWGENQGWLPDPRRLRGSKVGKMGTSDVPFRGPKAHIGRESEMAT